MLKVLVFLALVGPQAHAKKDCYTLLTFRGPEAADSPEARWRHTNTAQRDAGLAVELMKISPKERQAELAFNGRAKLVELSRANLGRMLGRLHEMTPIQSAPNAELLAEAKTLAAQIAFHYLRPLPNGASNATNTPIASPAELHKVGREEDIGDFYSTLVGGAPSVGFKVTATKLSEGTYYLGAQVNRDQIRLKHELAQESGYFLPEFTNALDLMNVMEAWEPGISESVLRSLRFSLPSDVKTVEAMRLYLAPGRLETVLPADALYSLLAPLRTRLNGYILTEEDGRAFITAALERFLIYTAQDESEFRRLTRGWERPGGTQVIFSSRFYEFLGFKGLQLRVPIAVSPAQYNIIRQEAHPGRFGSDPYGVHRQHLWDSRRLDNNLPPP